MIDAFTRQVDATTCRGHVYLCHHYLDSLKQESFHQKLDCYH